MVCRVIEVEIWTRSRGLAVWVNRRHVNYLWASKCHKSEQERCLEVHLQSPIVLLLASEWDEWCLLSEAWLRRDAWSSQVSQATADEWKTGLDAEKPESYDFFAANPSPLAVSESLLIWIRMFTFEHYLPSPRRQNISYASSVLNTLCKVNVAWLISNWKNVKICRLRSLETNTSLSGGAV